MVQKGTNVTQSWDLNNFRKVYDMILKAKRKTKTVHQHYIQLLNLFLTRVIGQQ